MEKRIFSLVVFLILMIGLFACGGNNQETEKLKTRIDMLEKRTQTLEEFTEKSFFSFKDDGEYDFGIFLIDFERLNQMEIGSSIVRIYISTSVTINGQPDTIKRNALGILLANGYILALEPALIYKPPAPILPPPGATDFPVELLPPTIIKTGDDSFTIKDNSVLELFFTDEENRVSLLRIPDDINLTALGYRPLPIKTGEDLELEVGNYLYLYGLLGEASLIQREARVEALEIFSDLNLAAEYNWSGLFSISPRVYTEAGTAVVAFRDGSPELVGIVLGYLPDGSCLALRISAIIEVISQKTGVNLK